ncbi:MAG: replication initiator protein A [Gemmatimonadaceae bacterium]
MSGAKRATTPPTATSSAVSRRFFPRAIALDRALEALPLFRLSDSTDERSVLFVPEGGGRWRVLPSPGDRLPGTFDQDVYVELCRRFCETGMPNDGAVTFTLHAFLRSIGRRADGRTYEQMRAALNRLERTSLESIGAYWNAASGTKLNARFTLLSAVTIDRRRSVDRDQLPLFAAFTASEPGDARVVLSPQLRANMTAGHVTLLSASHYLALSSPVARRLYRLLEVARADDVVTWRVPLERLAELVPLAQRYPSHLQRVLQPAHEMLLSAGILRDVTVQQIRRQWHVDYVLGLRLP